MNVYLFVNIQREVFENHEAFFALNLKFLFQREKEIGNGASLVYPAELLDAIRELYPDGIKNYTPKSGKVSVPFCLEPFRLN